MRGPQVLQTTDIQPPVTPLGEYQLLLPRLLICLNSVVPSAMGGTQVSSFNKNQEEKNSICVEFWRFQGSFLTGLHTQSTD